MKKYVALLHSINVGGKNKINMTELKLLFESIGFMNIITYINSGNIIFSSDMENEDKIRNKCELAIKDKFKLNIDVIIMSEKNLSEALKHIPNWWDKDTESKHNVIFVIPPVTAEEIIEQIGVIKPEYEKLDFYEQIIFWSAPTKTYTKTQLTKLVHKSNSITIRNANTTKKLLEIIKSI